jgi:hypothetical protein
LPMAGDLGLREGFHSAPRLWAVARG